MSEDNGDRHFSVSHEPGPIEERRSRVFHEWPKGWLHKIKNKCKREKDPKTKDLADDRAQDRRNSSSEEVFGKEPHTYSGVLNGVAAASTTGGPSQAWLEANGAPENDSDDRSRPLPISSLEQIIPVTPSALRTTFKMVIHMQGDETLTRMVQLDTGSSVDLLSQLVVLDLGKDLEPCEGQVIPLGKSEPIRPLGKVTLDWHIMGKPKTYKTTFLVLDAESSEDFDVLLSRDTIGRIGFYKTDDKVWVLSQGSG